MSECSKITEYTDGVPNTGQSDSQNIIDCTNYMKYIVENFVPDLNSNIPSMCVALDTGDITNFVGAVGESGTPTTLNKGDIVSSNNRLFLSTSDGNTDTPPSLNFMDITRATTKPMIAFELDGAYASNMAVATAMEAKNAVMGFAISAADIDIAGKITTQQLLSLEARGHEILNHGYNHVQNGGITYHEALADIIQGHEALTEMGLNIEGYVTPNSTLHLPEMKEVLARQHRYAHTVYNGTPTGEEGVYSESDSTTQYDLFRPNIEGREAESKAIIDSLSQTNGMTIFYMHEVDSATQAIMNNLIDYARAADVEVVTPNRIAREFVARKGLNTNIEVTRDAGENKLWGNFSSSTGDSVTNTLSQDGNDLTLSVTAGDVGSVLVANASSGNNFPATTGGEITLSFRTRCDDQVLSDCKIGIRVHKTSDGSVVVNKESDAIEIRNRDREFRISTGVFDIDERYYITAYMRIGEVGAIDATVSLSAYMHFGSVYDKIQEAEDTVDTVVNLDTTTITNNARTSVNLAYENNDFFYTAGSDIVFKRGGVYSLSPRSRSATSSDKNGHRLMSYFEENESGIYLNVSDTSVVGSRANFDNQIIVNVKPNTKIRYKVWTDVGEDIDITATGTYNIIRITKIN